MSREVIRMLEFFDPDDKAGIATFYDRHILFNTKLIRHFAEAYKVRVGFDKELRKIYVFPIDRDFAESGQIKESSLLSLSVSKSYVRVASKPLMDFIAEAFGIKIAKGESKQFKATYDENKKCVVIDLGGAE